METGSQRPSSPRAKSNGAHSTNSRRCGPLHRTIIVTMGLWGHQPPADCRSTGRHLREAANHSAKNLDGLKFIPGNTTRRQLPPTSVNRPCCYWGYWVASQQLKLTCYLNQVICRAVYVLRSTQQGPPSPSGCHRGCSRVRLVAGRLSGL